MRTTRRRVFGFLSTASAAVLLLVLVPAAPAAAAVPPGIPTKATAQSQLNGLTVKSEGASSDYDRSLFPHWVTISGNCNAREYVLRRDGSNVRTDDRCRATSGSWYSEFDGVSTNDSSTFDIDHLVPLSEAWRSGADRWSTTKRRDFANDVNSPALWAVNASSNRAKGDQDPADWMPPRTAIHCKYVKAWINVKHRYNLAVNSAEKSALQSTLNNRC
ncbi:HNH endonuclease [Nocardiopsis gilva YIM 90087]|uniref:HNH endonuclease n=1 Tax=Nocardiopsis gilva YIM 90087 TaxID=1235441 RepID=A0A223S914_9ACTN|nr:HNH endonuclease family protein [Nocardiopsis gilva]ASU84615.1 HNH endonuclease [Nocardiopsis gilva YIM 90087]